MVYFRERLSTVRVELLKDNTYVFEAMGLYQLSDKNPHPTRKIDEYYLAAQNVTGKWFVLEPTDIIQDKDMIVLVVTKGFLETIFDRTMHAILGMCCGACCRRS